jgi:hypothetical protein
VRELREFEAVFHISHAMFQLPDLGVVPEIGDDLGGLVVPLINGGAAVLCGISDGPVRVRAQASDAAPESETAPWDEMDEIVFHAPAGSVRVTPLFEDPVADIGVLTSGPGTYRLRVYARGRDTARNRFVDVPTEDYLIQVWPDPADR